MKRAIIPTSIGLIPLGLIFVSGGLGTFVAGRIEGLLVVFVGVAMLWTSWIGSQARSISCLLAACLNTIDATVTLASWNYEVNPFVLSTGPELSHGSGA